MTLVSAFGSGDLDPNRLNARGAQLLRAFVGFMESGGSDLGSFTPPPPELNPFEIDVRDRLTRAGIPLVVQYGVSGYRIDFAAQHPTQPGQMVLAIEADGAAYHSSTTVRDRDRLRQEHLERLGWRFHRIWSTDWFRDPDTEVARALTAYEASVRAADLPAARKAYPGTDRRSADWTAGLTSAQTGSTARTQRGGPRTVARPRIWPGEPIGSYSDRELVTLIQWIESDGMLRTGDELIREAMRELGFNRKGSVIAARLTEAIRRARRHG